MAHLVLVRVDRKARTDGAKEEEETHERIAGNKILNKILSVSGGKKHLIKTMWSRGLQHLHQLNCVAFMKLTFSSAT